MTAGNQLQPAGRAIALGVFASGKGTNFRAICQAARNQQLGAAQPVVLICDRDCEAIAVAEEFGVPAILIQPRDFPNAQAWEEALISELYVHGVELIALAGFMRLLGAKFLEVFERRVLNIHPSLLPNYPGLNAIARAYCDGVDSGVTIHWVDVGMDTGEVIAQQVVPINGASLRDFESEIHRIEHTLYPRVVAQIAANMLNESNASNR
ncbi:phosphoribosylglycinamide formyltransferase-1 [Arcanobacterium pluranimalium]|uniref:phosphoribosylglycinamide formyltransferase n=1 Tax=Arcanobacterium pluranimalium TaxID=108028 RepID=UPI0019589437|nr:phosphoribosylglycinamide formyltransferase [Arcanobacterium pluranimalium]MBM7824963.1 phosphoribosylglycinamide formyltransferase-1 [Arcanobacterium pluranimalium]